MSSICLYRKVQVLSCGRFQASAAKMRTALFWAITHRVVVKAYRRFEKPVGPTFRGPTGCPETSARNYHSSLRSEPEKRSSHVQCSSRTLVAACTATRRHNPEDNEINPYPANVENMVSS